MLVTVELYGGKYSFIVVIICDFYESTASVIGKKSMRRIGDLKCCRSHARYALISFAHFPRRREIDVVANEANHTYSCLEYNVLLIISFYHQCMLASKNFVPKR